MKAITLKSLNILVLILFLFSVAGCEEKTQYQKATITMTNTSSEGVNMWVEDETISDSELLQQGESRTHTIKRELEALYWDITVYAGKNGSQTASLKFRVSQTISVVTVQFNGTSIVRSK
jgi:hypothetical protein